MSNVPRIAIGTVQAGVRALPMAWALSNVLERNALHVQVFHSKACYTRADGGNVSCGLSARFLDSWLMSPELCHESFAHGSHCADLALVLGDYVTRNPGQLSGGSLDELCSWLDLPRLVVIDCARLCDCSLPAMPRGVMGLLLDRVAPGELPRLQTTLETLWGVPVLGALPDLSIDRSINVCLASGEAPSRCLCESLGNHLVEDLRVERLLGIALQSEKLRVTPWAFQPGSNLTDLNIAVAYDDAFHGYFPDVLDLLELQGARVRDFSPLRDEALPDGTNVVYVGGGVPDRYVGQLSTNHCLALALRNHVRQGRRLYAEGDGLAYLCGRMHTSTGETWPMAGVFPADAYQVDETSPRAVEIALSRNQWLAPRGSKLRGYRCGSWRIAPAGPLVNYVAGNGCELDLVGHQQAIGSQLQLNFAAQPDFLQRFSTSVGNSLNPTVSR